MARRSARKSRHAPGALVTMRAPGDGAVGGKLATFGGLCDLATTMADAAAPSRVWIQIAKVGTFKGHAAGAFALDDKVFSEIVQNFRATQNRRVPIDFEHASEADETSGTIPTEGAPAQGWIVDLDNRGDGGLWGLVEWLEPARTYIREGKYQFFSPAIRFGARDRVTGKPIGARLTSGALTNNPFLDGMQRLAARDFDAAPAAAATSRTEPGRMVKSKYAMRGDAYLPIFRAALKLDETAGKADMIGRVDRLRALYAQCSDPMGTPEGVDLGEYIPAIRAALGAPLSMTVEQMFDVVAEMIEHALAEHVEQLHPEAAETDDAPPSSARVAAKDSPTMTTPATEATATTTPAAVTPDETVVALKDATDKVAALTLTLKDAEARAAAAEAELVTLREAEAARVAADREARVGEAFATYKDAKRLTDDDKSAMRIVLANDAATFEKLYPRVPPAQAHLLRTVASGRVGEPAPADMRVPSMGDEIAALMKDGKMSLEQATSEAFRRVSLKSGLAS